LIYPAPRPSRTPRLWAAGSRATYALTGPARTDWEHSIPPREALRYSVTFRTFRGRPGAA
jgi:alkylated DNA repair dioxygenase AlkB